MWRSGPSALLLVLICQITPRPGDSQGGSHFKLCQDCRDKMKADVNEREYQELVQTANFSHCPHNIVRFRLPARIDVKEIPVICGDRINPWVDQVIKYIDDRISSQQSSKTQQEFSKGSNKNPPTSIQESPTSTIKAAPPLRLSTQTWTGGTLKPSETNIQKNLEPTIVLLTTAPDSDQNNDLLQGNGPPTKMDEQKSKMNQMTIAIISLILIVLVMSALGVYAWCRKAHFPLFGRHYTKENVNYELTPSIRSDLSELVP